MKIMSVRTSLVVLSAASALALRGADPSAFEVRNYQEAVERSVIREVKFDEKGKKLFRAYSGTVVKGSGVGGSAALKMEQKPGGKDPTYATVSLPPVDPGADYVVEVMVRAEGLRKGSSQRPFHCLAVESRIIATGKMAPWRDGTTRAYTEIPGEQWTKVTLTFKGKKGLLPFVVLGIPSGYEGTIFFDDLQVAKMGMPSALTLSAPPFRIFRTDNGKFEVSATPAKVSDPLLLAILHREKKILRTVFVRPDMDNVFRGDFGKGIEPGAAGVTMIFADAAAKVKLGVLETECSVESMDSGE